MQARYGQTVIALLADCMVQIADRSEVGHKSFEDAAFDDQCNTSEVDNAEPTIQMGGKLFARQKHDEFSSVCT